MFRILVLNDKKENIFASVKYLLHRYELVFSSNVEDAVNKLNENSINMILVSLPVEKGDLLKEWAGKKKTIAILDVCDVKLLNEFADFGFLACIDKMAIGRLPEIVESYLNKAETRIIDG